MNGNSAYNRAYAAQAKKLCQLGATDQELADFFDVAKKTISRWKHAHPEFHKALTVGKEVADERVKRSLYMRAVGYEHDAVKIFLSKEGVPIYAPYTEHCPPDTTACIFWLKNREPDKWREKQDHHHSGQIETKMSDLELARWIAWKLQQVDAKSTG